MISNLTPTALLAKMHGKLLARMFKREKRQLRRRSAVDAIIDHNLQHMRACWARRLFALWIQQRIGP